MITIYKYTLKIADEQTIDLPEGTEFLHAGEQQGKLRIWVTHDTDATLKPHKFFIFGTGEPVHEKARQYLATVQIDCLVWHVFGG